MSAPVVDHAKKAAIQEITSKSFFNVFNIVAIVAIVVIGYFLYKKFNQKFDKGAIKIPDILPMPISKVEAVPEPPKEPEEESSSK
jgi:hypothetical protein